MSEGAMAQAGGLTADGHTGRRAALGLAGAATAAGTASGQQAPDWPTRPIRLVVPFAPGGGADNQARLIAEPLSRILGQSVVVDNRGGAGGTLAAAYVAGQPADGHTVFYGTPGQLTINPILMRDLPYDAERDFQPVSLITRSAYAIAVHPSVRAQTLEELIALAKAQPGRIAYSSSGVGSGPHLAGELFRLTAGIDITHVPYRGSGPALQDLVGGQIPMSVDSFSVMIPLLQRGAVRGLGVTTARRSPLLPEIPTVGEVLPGYEVTVFNFIALRSGTPRAIVDRLSRAVGEAMRDPAVVRRNDSLGVESVGTTPEECARVLREESAKWRDAIARAGIRLE
jgi:tripartite-type tricarboxylate transporter receptor subunit TctC